eukprot:14381102-Alexandrium_andersonii.AAC.1
MGRAPRRGEIRGPRMARVQVREGHLEEQSARSAPRRGTPGTTTPPVRRAFDRGGTAACRF